MTPKISKSTSKTKAPCSKKAQKTATLFDIELNSISRTRLLKSLVNRVKNIRKTFVATLNPEFVVFARKSTWFRKILASADFAVPDGIGLVLAGWFLGQPPIRRIAGSDLVIELLRLAQQKGWSVGVVGARQGDKKERMVLISRLQEKFPQARVISLEDSSGWQKRKLEVVIACHGMGDQEKWVSDNIYKCQGVIFIGAGGSLDFLTGFTRRAPLAIRRLGLEWLWRGLLRPAHFKRVWTAVVIFPLLVIKERLNKLKNGS